MKKILLLLPLFAALPVLFFDKPVQAQQSEVSNKRIQYNFYRHLLQIDSVKAARVSDIQDHYKTALKAVVADIALDEGAKRYRIRMLMDDKNRQLRSLLTPAQQEKIIPTTERNTAQSDRTGLKVIQFEP